MVILAIDYGRKKIGLAISRTPIAKPFAVIRFSDYSDALEQIKKITKSEGVQKIIVGLPEGPIAEEVKQFAKKLERTIKLPVRFQNETLSTKKAIELSIEAGMSRKKRKNMEDAYSAALILQDYLEK